MIYKKFKTEIWGGLSLIVAIVIPLLFNNNPDNKKDFNFLSYTIYIFCLVVVVTIFILIKNKSIKSVKRESLSPSNLKKTFKDVIDKTSTKYWHYGMSGEEIQREVNLKNYLLTSTELPEMKIILLHPDCNSFRERITKRNKGRDIDALIKRKKGQIISLLETIRTLPKDKKHKIEVRFTQTYPIWILQFIVTKTAQTEDVNQLYLKTQPNNRHSNDSQLYEASINTDIFDSFKNYFIREWESAIKTNNYEIPLLPTCADSQSAAKQRKKQNSDK